MKKLKRIILFFMSIFLLTGSMPSIASPFTDVPDTATYKDAATLLSALGIMEGNNGVFRPDEAITRAETTKVLCIAAGYTSNIVGGSNQFVDVDSSKWYSSVVSMGSALGFIKGYVKDGKKYFDPEREVTYTEFAIMAVRVLGYEGDLTAKDNLTYAAKAAGLGLFANLPADLDIKLKAPRKDVAVMLNNMLNTPTKAESVKESPKPLLYSIQAKLGVSVVSGIITTTAVDSAVTPNKIKVANVEYDVAVPNASDILTGQGKYLNAYAKNGKIVLVSSLKGTVFSGVLSRNSDQLAMYYKDSSGVERTIPLDPYVKLYLNGKASYSGFQSFKAGATITAVNTDDDSDYDFVSATLATGPFIVPADITSDSPMAVNAIGGISLKKIDGTEAKVNVTGAATKLSEIKKDDVLYVTATDDNSIVNLEDLRKAITGQVTSVILPTTTTLGTAVINGVSYKLGSTAGTVNVFDNKKFILDKTDTIISTVGGTQISGVAVNPLNYGFITAINVSNGFGGTVYQLRIKRLDNTDIIVQTPFQINDSFRNSMVYFTTDVNNTLININLVQPGPTRKVNIVGDTKVFAVRSGAAGITSIDTVKAADINIQDSTSGYQVVKPGSLLGDYGVLVLLNPSVTSVDTTGYGIVIRKAGAQAVVATSETLDLYDVYINGEFKTIKVKQGVTVPPVFSKVTMTSDVVIGFIAMADSNMVSGKLDLRDDTRLRLQGNATIFAINPNVKVFNTNGGVNLGTMSLVDQQPPNMTLVVDYSTGTPTIVMILIK